MSACAGSSTEQKSRFTSCVPRNCPARKRIGFKHFAGSVQMDRSPGRIGFMSTQRRENRWQRTGCTGGGAPGRHLLPLGDGRAEPSQASGSVMQLGCANASGGTAPPGFLAWFHLSDENTSPVASAWLATNSLQWDCLRAQFASLARRHRPDKRRSSPPLGAGQSAATGTPATHGASPPLISSPSCLARLHPTLPRVPAGRRRWAERYDGKRDLYLQHAA
jgi:hypothetical protein